MKDRRSHSSVKRRARTRTSRGIPSSARRARNLIECSQRREFIGITPICLISSTADPQITILNPPKDKKLSPRARRVLKKKSADLLKAAQEYLYRSAQPPQPVWGLKALFTKFAEVFMRLLSLV